MFWLTLDEDDGVINVAEQRGSICFIASRIIAELLESDLDKALNISATEVAVHKVDCFWLIVEHLSQIFVA